MADGTMGLDPNAGLWSDSTLGPSVFGDPGSNLIFSPPADPNAAAFPWLSNAPEGSVFSADASTPTMDFLDSMPSGSDNGMFDWTGLRNALSSGLGNVTGSIGDWISGVLPNKSASSLIPGTMALTYAGMQPNLDTGPINAILGQLGGSTDAIVRAATDPLQRNIAGGYGDLLQSQALRGIRGSSFGDTDIANYLSTTGEALGNAGANAAKGSLALQGDLATTIATLKNQAQKTKNDLYGRAFDVLGRGLNPGGYAGTTNIYTGGGGGGAARPTDNGFLGTGIPTGDIAAGASLASLFSDRRLKSNIVKVGEDPRGFGIYEYDIFGERTRGVMADEVEKVMPGAIYTVDGGYKMVNYGALYG